LLCIFLWLCMYVSFCVWKSIWQLQVVSHWLPIHVRCFIMFVHISVQNDETINMCIDENMTIGCCQTYDTHAMSLNQQMYMYMPFTTILLTKEEPFFATFFNAFCFSCVIYIYRACLHFWKSVNLILQMNKEKIYAHTNLHIGSPL